MRAVNEFDILLNHKIPVNDNVNLAVTAWIPASSAKKHPTVLVSTPYVSNEAHPRARKYVQRGYAMVSLDLRGRGASEGIFVPLDDHGHDVCHAIKWIKQQAWSDGTILMRGGSYRGMTQWMAAGTCPEEITSMIPTASVYPGRDFPTISGHRMQKYVAGWLGFVSGAASNINYYADSPYWQAKEESTFKNHTPFIDYIDDIGVSSEHYRKWIERLSSPADWETSSLKATDYEKMKMPILSVTGHYDGDQPGALRYYSDHNKSNATDQDTVHYLVIGPWDHGGTRTPRAELSSDITFGLNAAFDMDILNIDWFDWVLGKGPKPKLLEKAVAFYVGGENKWRYADDLNAIGLDKKLFYLSADKLESYDVFNSGHLIEEPIDNEPTHTFLSDPLDTRFLDVTDTDWNAIRDGNLRAEFPAFLPETLVFHSKPFETQITMAGQILVTLFLEVNTPDVDVFTTVYAIFPDGTPLYLGGDVVRARFRNGFEPEFLEKGNVEEFVFKNYLWNAWSFPKGTRLRLSVGPYNDPSAQKNYNSGGKLGFETKADAKTATITLHHNKDFPSRLAFPVVEN